VPVTVWPQLPQNRLPGGSALPQLVQNKRWTSFQ
jgi:hypothetical protein